MQIQRTKRFRHVLLFVCLSCMLLMTGCNKKPYSKDEVIKKAKEECKEDFTLLYSEKINNNHIKYTFETTGRKLTFTADSIVNVGYFFPTREKVIGCHYTKAVRSLYDARIREVLRQSPNFIEDTPDSEDKTCEICKGDFIVTSFEDLKEAAGILEKCNRIYAGELKYSTEEFVRTNPAGSINFIWYPSEKDQKNNKNEKWLFNSDINGFQTYEELLDELSGQYTQCYKNQIIPDASDIPQVFLDKIHASELKIILNNEEIDERCWYDYSQNSYRITIASGSLSILRDFLKKSGMDYTQNYSETTIKWNAGNDTWKLHYERHVTWTSDTYSTSLTRNRKKLSDITYEDSFGQHYVSVLLEDFASMLNLEYTIDEDNLKITFVSKNQS